MLFGGALTGLDALRRSTRVTTEISFQDHRAKLDNCRNDLRNPYDADRPTMRLNTRKLSLPEIRH
jgi:hypothetical protein